MARQRREAVPDPVDRGGPGPHRPSEHRATPPTVRGHLRDRGVTTTTVSSTGSAGFTAGGGIGWLMRRYGLGPTGLVRVVFNPADVAEPVPRGHRSTCAAAPDEPDTLVNRITTPPVPFLPESVHGRPVVGIGGCWSGELDAGAAATVPSRNLGTVIADVFAPNPYAGRQQALDPIYPPPGRRGGTSSPGRHRVRAARSGIHRQRGGPDDRLNQNITPRPDPSVTDAAILIPSVLVVSSSYLGLMRDAGLLQLRLSPFVHREPSPARPRQRVPCARPDSSRKGKRQWHRAP